MKKAVLFIVPLLLIYSFLLGKRSVFLNNIRYYAYPDYTRVVLDLSSALKIKEKILPGKNITRLYFDLNTCKFAFSYPFEKKKEIRIKSGNLKKIRLGKRTKNSLRVVFDFDKIGKYDKFYLTSPFRIVFDIFQQKEYQTKKHKEKSPNLGVKPIKPIGEDYSIVRQLGLGVHKIIIDPGHGGKDPGTSNRAYNLYEKHIVLDISKRLKSIFKQYSNYDIILTRKSDRYISLEERTAIANSQKSDLFVSVHVNSAPRKYVQGVETFFLNLTTDPWSISVAAQENAVSTKSIGEMKTIIEEIIKSSKKSESKILSNLIQKKVVEQLKTKYNHITSLGVKKAPFYVLVGARMPASLVEVSFISHVREAKRLKTQSYRYQIAKGLYYGIIAYIKSLGKK